MEFIRRVLYELINDEVAIEVATARHIINYLLYLRF